MPGGVLQGVRPRRGIRVYDTPRLLQCSPLLPDQNRFDLSNPNNQLLPSPHGWGISERNTQVLISAPDKSNAWHILACWLICGYGNSTPSESFLKAVLASCIRQRTADVEYHVPWSRHLLACLRYALGTTRLVGPRALAFNAHFLYFSSPHFTDSELVASHCWPAASALLLLDSFAPSIPDQILQQASDHTQEMWILRLGRPSDRAAADLKLVRKRAVLIAVLPPKSLILHSS